MMKKDMTRFVLKGLFVVGLSLAVSYSTRRLWAEGIPSPNAMTYSGTLTDGGGEATGNYMIEVRLWAVGDVSAPRCTTSATAVMVTRGAFSLPLPDACTEAVRREPNLETEVVVNGMSLGRSGRLGAVPYAVEARRASELTSAAANALMPRGAVLAFDLAGCPAGWSPYTPAANRVIIGVSPTLPRGSMVGDSMFTLTLAHLPSHNHGVDLTSEASGEHSHSFLTSSGGDAAHNRSDISVGNAGATAIAGFGTSAAGSHTHRVSGTTGATGSGSAFDNRQESIALLYCRKD